MYRRLLYNIPVLLMSFLLLAACNGCSDSKKKGQKAEESPINPMVQELDETPDDAVLVTLDHYDADSMYVTLVEKHVKTSYAYDEAMANGAFHGTMKKGNNYSVLATKRGRNVKIAVNTTELKGRWIYDEAQHRGIDFNEGGGMSSINSQDICFREWKLLNGKMYIYYVDMQQLASDRHQYLVEEANITALDENELIIQFRGDRLWCKRPSKQPLRFTGH